VGVLEYSVWINATPEQVRQTYADPSRLADWQTGKPVVENAQGAPGAPSSTYISRRGLLAARTTVLTADPRTKSRRGSTPTSVCSWRSPHIWSGDRAARTS